MIGMKQILAFSLIGILSCSTQAMQLLDDKSLAQTTGQDGITISIHNNNGKVTFDSIALETDGMIGSATHNKAAAINYTPTQSGTGIAFYGGSARNTPILSPISLVVDADGGAGNPLANISIAFAKDLSRITLEQFTFSLSTLDPNTHNMIASTKRDLLRTGQDGVVIDLVENNPLTINMQLGNNLQKYNTTHSAMFIVSGGALKQIEANNLEVMSYACTSAPNPICSEGGKLTLDLKLSATNSSGVRLNGLYGAVSANGLEFGKVGTLDPFDLKISNLTIGEAGERSATVFNNLKNGSIGNIGMNGMSITDFKMTVSGM